MGLKRYIDQIYLAHIRRTFHPKATENTFFSSEHEAFPTIEHMLGHRRNLNKFTKTEILSSTFFK